jgi:hypothetical protein
MPMGGELWQSISHALQTPSGKKIELSTLSSLYHIEVNPRCGEPPFPT